MGEKTNFEEERDNEMNYEEETWNEPEEGTRHLLLWTLVGFSLLLILVGWMFFTRQSFVKIDEKLKIDSAVTNEEAIDGVHKTFLEFGELIDQTQDDLGEIKAEEERRKAEAEQLNEVTKELSEDINSINEEVPTKVEPEVIPAEADSKTNKAEELN